jgi:hypothetical protein
MAKQCVCEESEPVCLAVDRPSGEGGANLLSQVADGVGGTCLYMGIEEFSLPVFAPTEAWTPGSELWGDPNLGTEGPPGEIFVERECPEVLELEKLNTWAGHVTFDVETELALFMEVSTNGDVTRTLNPALEFSAADRGTVLINRPGIYRISYNVSSDPVANGNSTFLATWQADIRLGSEDFALGPVGLPRGALGLPGAHANFEGPAAGSLDMTSTISWTGLLQAGEEIHAYIRAAGNAFGVIEVGEAFLSVAFLGEVCA